MNLTEERTREIIREELGKAIQGELKETIREELRDVIREELETFGEKFQELPFCNGSSDHYKYGTNWRISNKCKSSYYICERCWKKKLLNDPALSEFIHLFKNERIINQTYLYNSNDHKQLIISNHETKSCDFDRFQDAIKNSREI